MQDRLTKFRYLQQQKPLIRHCTGRGINTGGRAGRSFRSGLLESEKAALVEKNALLGAKVRKLEETNKALEASNAARDKFMGVIAHDLRSPFNTILGLSEIIAEDEMSLEDTRNLAKQLNIVTKNVNGLLLNLLGWSVLQTGKLKAEPSNLDMLGIIEKTEILLADAMKRKGLRPLAFEIGNAGTGVYADESMAFTIIRNLVANAIKFTSSGGTITVSAFEAENGFRGFAVKDTGVGMDRERANSLFDPSAVFSTSGTDGEKGTGLGLQLAREMVELHGAGYGPKVTARERELPSASRCQRQTKRLPHPGLRKKTASEELFRGQPRVLDFSDVRIHGLLECRPYGPLSGNLVQGLGVLRGAAEVGNGDFLFARVLLA